MTRTSKETGESSATPGPRGGESPGKGEGRASATAAMTPFKAKVSQFRPYRVPGERGTGARRFQKTPSTGTLAHGRT